VFKLKRLSDKTSRWVAAEIITATDLDKRVAVLKHYISVAQYCAWFHLYNGLFDIMNGLMMNPVARLSQTWKVTNNCAFL